MISRLREVFLPPGLTPRKSSPGGDAQPSLALGNRFHVPSVLRTAFHLGTESILTHPLPDRALNVDYPDPGLQLQPRAKGSVYHPHLLTDFKGNFVTVLEPW